MRGIVERDLAFNRYRRNRNSDDLARFRILLRQLDVFKAKYVSQLGTTFTVNEYADYACHSAAPAGKYHHCKYNSRDDVC